MIRTTTMLGKITCSFDGFYFSGMVWIFIEFFMIHVNEDCFLMKFISLSIFVWVIWARIQNGMYWMILNWCVFDWLIWLIGIHLWYGKVVFVVILEVLLAFEHCGMDIEFGIEVLEKK